MTTIHYYNIEKTSTNSHYTLTATSPDNLTKRTWGFQKNFTYQLIDNQTNTVLWTRQQKPLEPSPIELYVSVEGWSIINFHSYDRNCGLIAVSPQGQDTYHVAIEDNYGHKRMPLECLAPRRWMWRDNHMETSTAGYFWKTWAHFYFTQFEQRPLFVYSCYSGRRLVIDLISGHLVTDKAQKQYTTLHQWFRQEETNWIKQLFTEFMDISGTVEEPTLNDKKKRYYLFYNLFTATLMVGRLQLHEFVPQLHQLANKLPKDPYSKHNYHRIQDTELVYERRSLHLFINHALLSLNMKPLPIPCYLFYANEAAREKRHPLDLSPNIPNRQNKLNQLELGMTQVMVLEIAGLPDFIKFDWWEYDFYDETDKPYSICLTWSTYIYNKPHTLTEIRRLNWTKKRFSNRLSLVIR